MAATEQDARQRHGIIANRSDFWRYSSETGFDLTHARSSSLPAASPGLAMETSTSPVTIDPEKSALLVIDMQNFFLSAALGRRRGAGHAAMDRLVEDAIPACRKAGVRVIWVNWGLTEDEVMDMPPAVKRAFGFEAMQVSGDGSAVRIDKHGKTTKLYTGIGCEMGSVEDAQTGKEIDAGRLLMREQWNSALYPPLDSVFEEGRKLKTRPDVWIHKNRMSAMWGSNTALEEYLETNGIKTLLFAGVNTDQCVAGTLQDCFSKGYDCILLGDACGTTSPPSAQQGIEHNAANTWGFLATCKQLADGAARM